MKILFVAAMVGALIFSCKKTGTTPPDNNNNNNGNNGTGANADTVSNHLQFLQAQRIPGTSPKGPSASSLQISFKDTLFLVDQVEIPIKFLHMDTTKNVSGVFIQVVGLQGGPFASDYFDVPELPQMDSTSDTVSVVMLGIDPDGLDLPFDFNITITPHGANGDPITQITRPVRILKHHKGPTSGPEACDIVNPGIQVWDWDVSYIKSKKNIGFCDFYDDPHRVFNPGGQLIEGSCCSGVSVYGLCPKENKPNSILHFDTYYNIFKEQFLFFTGNTYFRVTGEDAPTPVPDSSDFCGGVTGFIRAHRNITSYGGNYQIVPATLPPDLLDLHDSLAIQLTETSHNGGGFGNGLGIIHDLDCKQGILIVIQADLEGFGQHLYRIYRLRFPDDPQWFSL